MSSLHVSPLSRLSETVAAVRARHLVTLINVGTLVERPAGIDANRHLFLGMSDISTPLEGHVLAGQDHIERLIAFLRDWDREAPMVIHCWAGISRSTAAAFISLCAINPEAPEALIARRLREASPTAYPNRLMVRLADEALSRRGRMIDAIERIGRGELASEAIPFSLAADVTADASR